jgi:beta-glucosidase
MKKRFFNKNFLWGAAVAAHQVEGGNEYNQWTIWERDNAERLAKKAEKRLSNLDSWPIIKNQAQNPENYISGKAVDHFDLYKEDFSLLEELHFNAFRFSVEWSRVEPREGEFDYKAIEYYRKYIAELKKRNIEPVVTLFHFTLPNWFVEKGGFEKLRNSKYFVRFTRKIMSELRVTYVILLLSTSLKFMPQVYTNIINGRH